MTGRLIDADAVLKDLDDLKKSPWYHFDNPFVRQGMRECMEVVEEACIKDAPTVDAIPVEFIKERREAYLENLLADDNLTAGKKIVKASALQELLNAWERKEE